MKSLVCLRNTPFIAGAEAAVLSDVPEFAEDHVGEIFIDDPWWGVMTLTVVPYSSVTYPTFNTWGSIMFDADCTHFRCGTALWWGALWAYVIPKGAFVLTS